jgi:hypothetical protein
MDEERHEAMNKGCAAIGRGKTDRQNLLDCICACGGWGDAWWHPRDSTGVLICYRLQPAILRASRLSEGLNNIGGGL